MAIHSSTIAWKIPWTEEPGRLQSMGGKIPWTESLIGYSLWGRKKSDTTERLHFHFIIDLRITAQLFEKPFSAFL